MARRGPGRDALRSLIVALAIGSGPAWAVDVTTPSVPVATPPGADVVVPFRVQGSPSEQIVPSVEVPDAWTMLLPEEPYALGALGGETRIVMVRVPEYTPPGRYAVRYAIDGAEGASAYVDVSEVRNVTTVVSTPDERAGVGDQVAFTVVVRNDGNVPADVVLRLNPDNLVLDDESPRHVDVPAGESVAYEVTGVVGEEGAEARLLVRTEVGGGPPIAAIAGLSVLPRNGKVDRWWRLPVALTLWNLTGNATGPVRTAFQGEVAAAGFLDQEQHYHLDLTLRGPDVRSVPGLNRYSQYGGTFDVDFEDWGGRVAAGDEGYRFTTLTEQGMWGRGGSIDARYHSFGLMGFVARERYIPNSPWQFGAGARFFAGDRARFTLGGHLARVPGRNEVTITHEGFVPLLRANEKHALDMLYELALGNLTPGALIDLRGRFPTTWFNVRGTYGAGDFPGEYGNRVLTQASLTQRIGQVTLQPYGTFSLLDIRRPGPKPMTALGGLRATWRPSVVSDLGLSWQTQDRVDAERGVFDLQHEGWLSAAYRTARGSLRGAAGARVRTADSFDGTALSILGEVEGTHVLTRDMAGSVGFAVDTNYLRRPGTSLLLAPSVTWSWQPGPGQLAYVTYLAQLYPQGGLRTQHFVQATADLRLPWRHWVRLRLTTFTDKGPRSADTIYLDAMLGYSVPLGIPLSRRKDLVSVGGLVTDHDTGLPVAGFPMELDGQQALTGPDGRYEFVAEPDRRHFLEVPIHDLPAGQVVLPRSQYDIREVTDPNGEPIVRDLEVAAGGTLRVRLMHYALVDAEYLWTGGEPEFIPDRPIANSTISIVNGDQIRRGYTDSEGWVDFERLPVGEWTVLTERPPADSEIEIPRKVVPIEANDSFEMEIKIRPKVVAARYIDSGEGTEGQPAPRAPIVVESFRVTPDETIVAPGGKVEILTQLVFSDGRVEDVAALSSWKSADPSVATVERGVIRGVAPGATTIHVKFDGRPSVPVRVEVVQVPFVGLRSEPEAITLLPGQRGQIIAQAIDVDGNRSDATNEVEWVSRDPSIVKTYPDGTVEGVGPGTTDVIGRLYGITAYPVKITVLAPPPASDSERITRPGIPLIDETDEDMAPDPDAGPVPEPGQEDMP